MKKPVHNDFLENLINYAGQQECSITTFENVSSQSLGSVLILPMDIGKIEAGDVILWAMPTPRNPYCCEPLLWYMMKIAMYYAISLI